MGLCVSDCFWNWPEIPTLRVKLCEILSDLGEMPLLIGSPKIRNRPNRSLGGVWCEE
jgi:hypothetical protein